jgi:hypothetical protein
MDKHEHTHWQSYWEETKGRWWRRIAWHLGRRFTCIFYILWEALVGIPRGTRQEKDFGSVYIKMLKRGEEDAERAAMAQRHGDVDIIIQGCTMYILYPNTATCNRLNPGLHPHILHILVLC